MRNWARSGGPVGDALDELEVSQGPGCVDRRSAHHPPNRKADSPPYRPLLLWWKKSAIRMTT